MSKWIQLESGFFRHRRTLRLKRMIGNDALWIVPRLWAYCMDEESDDISQLTDDDLAAILEYNGDVTALKKALVDCGFVSPDGTTVTGWKERYGQKLDFYHQRARRAANKRWGKSEIRQEEKETRLEGEEIRVASIAKHASSMLQASDAPAPVSFPWKSWEEVERTTRHAIEDKYPQIDYTVMFTEIRGRKLRFRDQHPITDWPSVLVSEFDDKAKTKADKYRSPFATCDHPTTNIDEIEPSGDWLTFFNEKYPDTQFSKDGAFEAKRWSDLSSDWKKKINREFVPIRRTSPQEQIKDISDLWTG